MNTNSINSYNEEVENGNIAKKHKQIIEWLKANHYGTARDIGKAIPGAWRRMSELVKSGKVEIIGDVYCSETNKVVSSYALPEIEKEVVKTNTKQPTRKQLIEKINELEMELAYKDSEIAQAYNDGIRFARTMRPVKRIWFKFW